MVAGRIKSTGHYGIQIDLARAFSIEYLLGMDGDGCTVSILFTGRSALVVTDKLFSVSLRTTAKCGSGTPRCAGSRCKGDTAMLLRGAAKRIISCLLLLFGFSV